MLNILLTIAYDGTFYGGWQRQKNAVTVQEVVEKTLSAAFKEAAPVKLTGASRTDSGVHALCQKACFFIESMSIPVERLPLLLNPLLPGDISITAAAEVSVSFNPRFHAKQKEYRYQILNCAYPIPTLRNYTWHVRRPLDLHKMRDAAEFFLGTHDFTAFSAAGSAAKTFTRTIFELTITESNLNTQDAVLYTVKIIGDGFLYNMVRIITGTLMYAGCGKLEPNCVPEIIEQKKRPLAGITAPPQGLTLWNIEF